MENIIKKDSNQHYHSQIEYISSTGLKKYLKSPLYFRDAEFETTKDLIFGSQMHCYLLEPELFKTEYHIFDEMERPDKTKTMAAMANQNWKFELIQKYGHDKLIDRKTFGQMKAMKRMVFSHPYAKYLLTGGQNELSHYTEMDGLKCKFRADSIIKKKSIIADYKTTTDATKEGFPAQASKYGYHFSAAFYTDLAEYIYQNEQIWKFYIVAQEKKPPYLFNIFKMSPQALGVGGYEYKQCLDQHKYCLETGEYRGLDVFCDNKYGINELNVPAWNIKEINFYNKYE